MGQSAQNIELLELPATGAEPLQALERRGLITGLWGAVCESRLVRTGVALLAGSAVLTACGKAEANQAPVAGTSNPSATGEQTPGSRPTTPPESSTRPPATSTSPSSIPSASQSTRPSGGNTSGSSSPTSSSPNSTPSTYSGEILTLGKPVTFMGKDMKQSARLPWETKDRGEALSAQFVVISLPGQDTPERVFGDFFRKSAAIANVGGGITKQDESTYSNKSRPNEALKADLAGVRRDLANALNGKDLSLSEPSRIAWFNAMEENGEITSSDIGYIIEYDPNTTLGDKTPYYTNLVVTMTYCSPSSSESSMSCNFTVVTWRDKEVKDMGEQAKITHKLAVSAIKDPSGKWTFSSRFEG